MGISYRTAGVEWDVQVVRRQGLEEQCYPSVTADVLLKRSADLRKLLIVKTITKLGN
jgi:hypothetical protein